MYEKDANTHFRVRRCSFPYFVFPRKSVQHWSGAVGGCRRLYALARCQSRESLVCRIGISQSQGTVSLSRALMRKRRVKVVYMIHVAQEDGA